MRDKLLKGLVEYIQAGHSDDDIEALIIEAQERAFVPSFHIWKTLKLGIYQNIKEIRQDLKNSDFYITDGAGEILFRLLKDEFELSRDKTEVNLLKLSVRELGYFEGRAMVPYKEIYKRAFSLNLKKNSAEIGPLLRLQYRNQPKGENLNIFMDDITVFNGHDSQFNYQAIFCVGHDIRGGYYFGAVSSEHGFHKNDLFVFCCE